MAKIMTKSGVVSHLADKGDLTKKQVAAFIDEVHNLAVKEAKKNGAFVLPGIGKVVLQNRKARMGRNPQTGEPIKIPAKRVCKFRLAKSLKDAVLGKK
jgi:DNA-binding protein HU-beta